MTELDPLSLFRKFRVHIKNDDDIFRIKYVITDDFKPSKHEQGSSSKQQRQVSKDYLNKKDGSKQSNRNLPHIKTNSRQNRFQEGRKNKPRYQQKQHNKQWKLKQKAEIKEVKAENKGQQEVGIGEALKDVQKIVKKEQVKKSKDQQQMDEQLVQPQEDEEGSEDEPKSEDKDKEEVSSNVEKNVSQQQQVQTINKDKEAQIEKQNEDEIFQQLEQIQLKTKFSQFKQPFSEMDLNNSLIKDTRKLYDQYIDLSIISKSRRNEEGIYHRGIVQFSDTIKWYCNIVSNEVEGVLVAQGRNTNRAIHEDQVYFRVVSEGKEKILCAVVAIVRRRLNEVVGKIQFNKSKQIYLLKSTNAKFASMNINPSQVNKQWLQNGYTKYFLAQFAYWNASDDHPFCRILREYGNFGSVQIETQALLKNYSIENRVYEEKQMEEFIHPFKANINEKGQYVISAQEMKKRKDFRRWRTFIVKDSQFDAAFSISPLNVRGKADPNFLKKNIFQINVHFIDVAFFAQQNSDLDKLARKILTNYNLVHKNLALLPQPFSNTFCKLRQNKDILTISVGFQIDEEGNILDMSKIAKSIINPAFTFSNDELQRVISADVPFEEWKAWNCGCKMESQYKVISADIKLINKLIAKRRQTRIQSGALIFEIPIKNFQFDSNLNPTHFALKVKNEAHYMIEECVISASAKVGEFLFKNLKSKAILYRHRFPGFKRLNKFKESLKKMGQSLPQNSKQIQKYINEMMINGQIKQCIKDTIKYQTIKLLQNCDYFQVLNSHPSAWVHYAINIPIYTHCSTPSKSYGDLIVQRQIVSVLQKVPWKMEEKETNQLLEVCNKSKLISQQIRTGCQKIFLCLYLRENPVFTTAVLTQIEQWGIKMIIAKFNIKTMIKFKQLKTIKVTKMSIDQNSRKYVKIDFTNEQGDYKTKIVLKEMQEINIRIGSANTYPLDYAFNIVLPHPSQAQKKILIS